MRFSIFTDCKVLLQLLGRGANLLTPARKCRVPLSSRDVVEIPSSSVTHPRASSPETENSAALRIRARLSKPRFRSTRIEKLNVFGAANDSDRLRERGAVMETSIRLTERIHRSVLAQDLRGMGSATRMAPNNLDQIEPGFDRGRSPCRGVRQHLHRSESSALPKLGCDAVLANSRPGPYIPRPQTSILPIDPIVHSTRELTECH